MTGDEASSKTGRVVGARRRSCWTATRVSYSSRAPGNDRSVTRPTAGQARPVKGWADAVDTSPDEVGIASGGANGTICIHFAATDVLVPWKGQSDARGAELAVSRGARGLARGGVLAVVERRG